MLSEKRITQASLRKEPGTPCPLPPKLRDPPVDLGAGLRMPSHSSFPSTVLVLALKSCVLRLRSPRQAGRWSPSLWCSIPPVLGSSRAQCRESVLCVCPCLCVHASCHVHASPSRPNVFPEVTSIEGRVRSQCKEPGAPLSNLRG